MLRFFLLFLLVGCVKNTHPIPEIRIQNPYFLVLLVDARQLNYANNQAFFQSMVKHPSDGSKNSDVGHAWIYLRGSINGQPVELEGGLSGETGVTRLKYFEGVAQLIEKGDPNPIKYLWTSLNDGYYEEGSGRHLPTYAIKIDLTEEQFFSILNFVEGYTFNHYSLTKHQCCSFVQEVARQAGLELQTHLTMTIQKTLKLGKYTTPLWQNPLYSTITFPCPEVLEASMKLAVSQGKAQPATQWYLQTHPRTLQDRFETFSDNVCLFPSRILRVYRFAP